MDQMEMQKAIAAYEKQQEAGDAVAKKSNDPPEKPVGFCGGNCANTDGTAKHPETMEEVMGLLKEIRKQAQTGLLTLDRLSLLIANQRHWISKHSEEKNGKYCALKSEYIPIVESYITGLQEISEQVWPSTMEQAEALLEEKREQAQAGLLTKSELKSLIKNQGRAIASKKRYAQQEEFTAVLKFYIKELQNISWKTTPAAPKPANKPPVAASKPKPVVEITPAKAASDTKSVNPDIDAMYKAGVALDRAKDAAEQALRFCSAGKEKSLEMEEITITHHRDGTTEVSKRRRTAPLAPPAAPLPPSPPQKPRKNRATPVLATVLVIVSMLLVWSLNTTFNNKANVEAAVEALADQEQLIADSEKAGAEKLLREQAEILAEAFGLDSDLLSELSPEGLLDLTWLVAYQYAANDATNFLRSQGIEASMQPPTSDSSAAADQEIIQQLLNDLNN